MARLTQQEFSTRIKTPINAGAIKSAREQEDRLVFHCEPILDRSLVPAYAITTFLDWVASFLPKDKMKRFKQLLTVPVDTVISTQSIFDELSKFLDAQDRYFNYEFTSESMSADFNEYASRLDDANFWRTHGMQALSSRINSMLVVDCPVAQNSDRPEPYYYLVNIHNIKDGDIDARTGRVEYLIFQRDQDKAFVCIDDEFYRVYTKPEGQDEYIMQSESAHSIFSEGGELIDGLGYCPVTSFFSRPIHGGRRFNNRGPITNALGKLDWLLFWRTSKKYLDLYGAYPIIVSYKSECNYRDKNGETCVEGYVTSTEWRGEESFNVQNPCPVCSARETIGPGSYWEVDAPSDKDDVDLLKNPVNIVEMGQDKLDYGVTEIARLEDEVYLDCVGFDGDALQNEAVNKLQVRANFESKEAVLDGIKSEFERANRFVMETVCRLRYGAYFKRCVIDYGSQYFMKSAEALTKEYADAKTAGMPGYYLATLRNQVRRTRFKNNPQQMQRDDIMAQLEPYPDLTAGELVALQIPTVDPENFIVKLNFYSFVQRFEREQTDIVTFGSQTSFKNKIQLITQKLQDYARERKAAPSAQHEPGTAG